LKGKEKKDFEKDYNNFFLLEKKLEGSDPTRWYNMSEFREMHNIAVRQLTRQEREIPVHSKFDLFEYIVQKKKVSDYSTVIKQKNDQPTDLSQNINNMKKIGNETMQHDTISLLSNDVTLAANTKNKMDNQYTQKRLIPHISYIWNELPSNTKLKGKKGIRKGL
jgi:hypothetical protein